MIARFHDDEEVQRIGGELRPVRQAAGLRMLDARGRDLGRAPLWLRLDLPVHEVGQGIDLLGGKRAAEAPASASPSRPFAMTLIASARLSRSRFSGSSAGPIPPSRSAPWQRAQCAA